MQTVNRFIRCFVLIFMTNPIFSLEYGLFAKKDSSVPITKYFLINERCSGSNYLRALIKQKL